MSTYDRRHRIEAWQQQAERLRSAVTSPARLPGMLPEALAVLQTSLEELCVADEEIHQQHEALAVAQQTAEVARQRYQALFDLVPDGYLVTSNTGVIQEANRAAAALLALPQAALVGKSLASFVPQEERQLFRTQLAALSTRQRLQDWEVRLRPREGTPFQAALTVTAVHSPQGALVGLRWLLRDVTAPAGRRGATRQRRPPPRHFADRGGWYHHDR